MKLPSNVCIAVLCVFTASCTTPSPRVSPAVARVTFYCPKEDKWGSRIASSKRARAKEGLTIAAERAFPFGTRVHIPRLWGIVGDGHFVVQDRGTAVQARKASYGSVPVFDIYVASRKKMKRLLGTLPDYLPYHL